MRMKYIRNVSMQALLDVGLNAFAVKLLAESYALHPNPQPVAFSYESEKNGKPIKVFVRFDPEEPHDSEREDGRHESLPVSRGFIVNRDSEREDG
jgi:hypothetical protein